MAGTGDPHVRRGRAGRPAARECGAAQPESDPEGALDTVRLALTREPDRAEGLELESRLLAELGRNSRAGHGTGPARRSRGGGARPGRSALDPHRIASSFGGRRRVGGHRRVRARPRAPGRTRADAVDALLRLHEAHERWDRTARAPGLRVAPAAVGRRALELHTRHGELLLAHFDEPDAARAAFRAALEADPSDPACTAGARTRRPRERGRRHDSRGLRARGRRHDRPREAHVPRVGARPHSRDARPAGRGTALDRATRPGRPRSTRRPRDVLATARAARPRRGAGREPSSASTSCCAGTEQAANRRRLAELHAKGGDTHSAIDAYRRALQADPEDLASLRALLEPLNRARARRASSPTPMPRSQSGSRATSASGSLSVTRRPARGPARGHPERARHPGGPLRASAEAHRSERTASPSSSTARAATRIWRSV